MRAHLVRLALPLIVVAASGSASAAASDARPSIRIVRATSPVGFDGPAADRRSAAAVVDDFRQREPNDGEKPSRRTTVYLSFDDEKLYAVFVCEEDPARVRAHLSRREDIASDDSVTLWLDTFHDGRHAYEFSANALGVQLDGLLTEGQEDDYSFDTVWDAEGHVTSTGFVVRMAVPFRSLRYGDSPDGTWGIAVGRDRPDGRELATWPYMSARVAAFIPQFATLAGLDRLPRGVHAEVTPYASGSMERATSPDASPARSVRDWRGGADAKVSAGNDWTIDLTVNPDFSQVESDEPQVTANQRYEVFFPERRPFFTDRAGFFQTPESIFFSRRIVDPRAGARVTGTAGGWTIGALVADDRAAPGTTDDTFDGVMRAQRQVGGASTIGVSATARQDAAGSASLVSMDTRLVLGPNWILTGQAMRSSGSGGQGNAAFVEIRHAGRHLTYYSNYRDRTPDFQAALGYMPRADMRQMKHVVGYKWRPARGPIVSVGPSVFTLANWNYARRLQDTSVDAPVWIDLKGPSTLAFGRTEAYELYRGVGFRRHSSYAYFSSEALRWAAVDAMLASGTSINFYPAGGQAPFAGDSTDASLGLTFRPSPRLRLAQAYLFSRLTAAGTRGIAGTVFSTHLARTKISYQFTRELSIRGIADYDAALPNPSLVTLDRARRLTLDVLMTYLVHPGTALYIGVTDRREALDRFGPQSRQLFVKLTELVRF